MQLLLVPHLPTGLVSDLQGERRARARARLPRKAELGMAAGWVKDSVCVPDLHKSGKLS